MASRTPKLIIEMENSTDGMDSSEEVMKETKSNKSPCASDASAEPTHVSDELLAASQNIIAETFARFALAKIGVAFNGGKDCVVMTELLLATVGVERLRQCCIFVLDEPGEFAELVQFREQYIARRVPGATLRHYDATNGLCAGLWNVKREHGIEAAFIGTRKSDPAGKYQRSPQEPTTEGWPPMLRVCPVFCWSYEDVWSYIRAHNLPYCDLYLHGYTSLGRQGATTPHERLLKSDGTYLPAWELESSDMERGQRD